MMSRILFIPLRTLFSSTDWAATQRAKELADIIVSSTLEMQKAIGLLTNQIDQTQILKYLFEINRMENEADIIYRTALVELFANTADEKLLIKWRWDLWRHGDRHR